MLFVRKYQLSEVKVVLGKERQKLCKACPFKDKPCYMCSANSDEVLAEWLEHINHRTLYILRNDDLPVRKRRCPWCEENLTEEHLKQAHNRTKENVYLYDTQQKTWQNCRQVRRTGRWWALPATFSQCQRCCDPQGSSCSLGISPMVNVRCIHSLGLDPKELCLDLTPWETGFVIS